MSRTTYYIQAYFLFFVILVANVGCKSDKQENKTKVLEEQANKTELTAKSDNEKKKILFFGDSLTAGYQLEEDESFPSLIQDTINTLGLSYEVINAGLSGETSSNGKSRIDWVLNQSIDVFVLELGPNDVLRGFDLNITEQNLRDILDVVQSKQPHAALVIAGMEAPPNMGTEYTAQFSNIFKDLAKDYNAALIPFLLDGVAGIAELNLQDGKHPNARGQKIVANNVWKILKGVLD